MKTKIRAFQAEASAFTLVEVLVVVAIIGILVAILFPTIQGIRKSGGEAKSLAVMKSVLQGCALYAADNNGQINTLKWETDPLERPWVGGTFWGRVAPYLFSMPRITDQKQMQTYLLEQLKRLFGTDPRTMKGTPFEGPKIYGDTAAVGLPFAFNKYLYEFYKPGINDGWVTQLQVATPASTIYMTYGSAMFDEEDAATYTELPKNGAKTVNNIYFLPPNKTIAGFLDGRVEILTAPIPEKMVKIDGL